jgi:hypothetical protein
MASTLAHVTPEVLRWARESIGYEMEDAAARIGVKPEKLANAERGDVQLEAVGTDGTIGPRVCAPTTTKAC